MAGANRKSMISKSVSQLFGQTVENSEVIPFSDDKQFNISGRIPAYALMERRTSKHAVSGPSHVCQEQMSVFHIMVFNKVLCAGSSSASSL